MAVEQTELVRSLDRELQHRSSAAVEDQCLPGWIHAPASEEIPGDVPAQVLLASVEGLVRPEIEMRPDAWAIGAGQVPDEAGRQPEPEGPGARLGRARSGGTDHQR